MTEFNLNKYNVIVFDCDGVLLDINHIKVDAFKAAVSMYPIEIQEKFAEYCSNSFGISRYKKFQDFFPEFAKKAFNEEEYYFLLKRYADICATEYLSCPITTGTIDCLNQLKEQGYTLYISSGSDENELRVTFKKRNLENYFNEIYGSPKTKYEALKEIFKIHDSTNVLFIGDSKADMKAALQSNIDFVYMSEYTIQSNEQHINCIENTVMHIRNLTELIK